MSWNTKIFVFLQQFSQDQIRNFEECHNIDECLDRLRIDNNLAVGTSRLYLNELKLYENIFCFEQSQNIHDFSTTFMIRREFAMKREFIDTFNRLVISGLISKWDKDMKNSHTKRKLHTNDFDVHSINMTDFYFAFVFASFFIIPSIVVFILERLIHYKAHTANANLQKWIFFDEFITAKRQYFLLERRNNDDVVFPFTN